ncbi:hypothetical protein BRADI_4g17223v3 [Brachypodium distachyon]|uniref:Uncharacterized protein n=1 Tax=Brachypodium distachyon TaxID=15368 RepID=A0A2K2CNC7_BRADI|nr:hypothetical protein BRADI_4g17223v3 [Brachypodium distachyon]PNT63548.1 hypothetical protein BRADI_4g17223v3 [Brachypodium distachyon]PNT63549.1 hypothetical protein BRADI_4g17223v3 [Brachypodium distachyon]
MTSRVARSRGSGTQGGGGSGVRGSVLASRARVSVTRSGHVFRNWGGRGPARRVGRLYGTRGGASVASRVRTPTFGSGRALGDGRGLRPVPAMRACLVPETRASPVLVGESVSGPRGGKRFSPRVRRGGRRGVQDHAADLALPGAGSMPLVPPIVVAEPFALIPSGRGSLIGNLILPRVDHVSAGAVRQRRRMHRRPWFSVTCSLDERPRRVAWRAWPFLS